MSVFDLEIVSVAPHNHTGVSRHTGRYEEPTLAYLVARIDNMIRRTTDETTLLSTTVWEDGSHGVGVVYTIPDGDIVAYANLREVVGE